MAKFYAFHFLILTQQLLWLLVLHENNNSCIVVSGFSTKPSSPTASSDASPPSIIHDNNDNNNRKNVNFIDWISDAPEEVKGWKPLQVEEDGGKIPSYVQGTLIRNGGGIWTDDTKNKEMFSHIFDGLAKIHAYRITQTDNGRPPTVEYQARFLQGSWFRSFLASRTLPFGIGTGPVLDSQSKEPKTGYWRTVQAVWNTVTKFDNTPVNIWDYQPNSSKQSKVITALTDAPSRTRFDFSTMDTISSSKINAFAKGSKGYELLCTGKVQQYCCHGISA
jgi:carotenoid cleavage dioxygenase-like enzyme